MEKILVKGLAVTLSFSRRRRSVSLQVTEHGEVVARVPHGLSRKAITQVIEKHRAWLEKKQAALKAAWANLEPGKAYFRGQALSVHCTVGAQDQISLTDGLLKISLPTTGAAVWPRLVSWYTGQAVSFLKAGIQRFAPSLGLVPPPFEVRSWRRRWGECRADGRLCFNWRLILLPPPVLDYVVIHELAHLKIPGHSPRFWQEVAAHLPDFAGPRQWLKVYGVPFLFWRFEPTANGNLQGEKPLY